MKFKSVNFAAGKCLLGKSLKAWNLKVTDRLNMRAFFFLDLPAH